jgi:hypothetical protein
MMAKMSRVREMILQNMPPKKKMTTRIMMERRNSQTKTTQKQA